MPNELDEMTGPVNQEGRDVNVIDKQIPVKTGFGSILFEVILWVLAIIPGLIFLFMKINAQKYFRQLQQRIQHNASQIDNYLEQRVQILQNVVGIVEKSIDLDKDVMKSVAAFRGGVHPNEQNRNQVAGELDAAMRSINVAFEAYPDLKANQQFLDLQSQLKLIEDDIAQSRKFYNGTTRQYNTTIETFPNNIIAGIFKFTRKPHFEVEDPSQRQNVKVQF
jgi:LemA protein